MSSTWTTLHHHPSSQTFILDIHPPPHTVMDYPPPLPPDIPTSWEADILTGAPTGGSVDQFPFPDREESGHTDLRSLHRPAYCLPLRSQSTGHWFLAGWIGDHYVEFLVDSFYQTLVHAGASLGTLEHTARTLRSANGTGIEVLGCSRCVVLFMGLQTQFLIIICNLTTGTDAIFGTDVLGSVLPPTLVIKNGLFFAKGGASLQLHRRDSALSGHVFTVGHCSIPPYSQAVLHCSVRTTGGRALPSSGLLEGLTLFAENTGLIVGRTLVEMEDSSPCVKFQPGDYRSGPIHGSVNDYTGHRYTVRGGAPLTVTHCD